jgi:hypothetical protein
LDNASPTAAGSRPLTAIDLPALAAGESTGKRLW